MSKVRIYTLAKDLGVENAKMLELLDGLGVSYKSVSSTIEEETVELIKEMLAEEAAQSGGAPRRPPPPLRATLPRTPTPEPPRPHHRPTRPQLARKCRTARRS